MTCQVNECDDLAGCLTDLHPIQVSMVRFVHHFACRQVMVSITTYEPEESWIMSPRTEIEGKFSCDILM